MASVLEREIQEPSVVAAGMEQFNIPYFLFSVHYMPLREERDYRTRVNGGYRTSYQMAAVEKRGDRPSMLLVKDGYQRIYIGADSQTGRKRYEPKAESAGNIARDIVQVATGAEPGAIGKPAVWVSKATKLPMTDEDWATWGTPGFAAKFPEFMAEVEQAERDEFMWCEGMLKEADSWHTQALPINIGSQHRAAAYWMGANAAEHPWIKATNFGGMIECPECGAKTSANKPRCQNCLQVINVKAQIELEARRQAERDEILEQDTRPTKEAAPHGAKKN